MKKDIIEETHRVTILSRTVGELVRCFIWNLGWPRFFVKARLSQIF